MFGLRFPSEANLFQVSIRYSIYLFQTMNKEVNDVKEIYFGQFRRKQYFIICSIILNQQ